MADTTVPIQSAALKFNSDGELKTAGGGGGGGGGTTSDTAVVTVVPIPDANTAYKLLDANPDRKGFILHIYAVTVNILYGGVDGSGNVIPYGDEGGILNPENDTDAGYFTMSLPKNVTYVSDNPVYTGPIVCAAFTSNPGAKVSVTELL